jgi:hypothetical protein
MELVPSQRRKEEDNFVFCGGSYLSKPSWFRLNLSIVIYVVDGVSELGISFCGSLTAFARTSGSEKLIMCFLTTF